LAAVSGSSPDQRRRSGRLLPPELRLIIRNPALEVKGNLNAEFTLNAVSLSRIEL
jgi:hypothetical protein